MRFYAPSTRLCVGIGERLEGNAEDVDLAESRRIDRGEGAKESVQIRGSRRGEAVELMLEAVFAA